MPSQITKYEFPVLLWSMINVQLGLNSTRNRQKDKESP